MNQNYHEIGEEIMEEIGSDWTFPAKNRSGVQVKPIILAFECPFVILRRCILTDICLSRLFYYRNNGTFQLAVLVVFFPQECQTSRYWWGSKLELNAKKGSNWFLYKSRLVLSSRTFVRCIIHVEVIYACASWKSEWKPLKITPWHKHIMYDRIGSTLIIHHNTCWLNRIQLNLWKLRLNIDQPKLNAKGYLANIRKPSIV